MFVGGARQDHDNYPASKNVFFFDFFRKKWIVPNVMLSKGLHNHNSLFVKKRDHLHIIGGYTRKVNKSIVSNLHYRLHLRNILPIRWQRERQLWIGFKQNKENENCLIDQIPKAVLFHILSFLR